MTKTITISNKAITKLTTPQLLKGCLYLTWGASLLLLIATIFGVQEQRHAIKAVGKDSAPSIVTAQRLKDALASMDANAVNELLARPGQNPDALKGYEESRQKVAQRLVAAAENITYGDAERQPIQTMQLALGDYLAKIQQARDFHARGDTNGVLVAYRAAAEILDKTLLPAADALDKANLAELETTYSTGRSAAARSLFFVVISSLLLIAVLVAIQLFLNRRMRRILNPMLLAATAIAIIFLGYATQAFFSASHHLKVAKEDAFTSMHALRQARALAYSANADESRYLLDPAFARTHEQAFFYKTTQIAQLPSGQSFKTILASPKGVKVAGFTGYLADELNNITFRGEREALMNTLSSFNTYLNIDKQIRQLQRNGKHLEAIDLCVSSQEGKSNRVFDQFLQAHQEIFDINEQAFNNAIEQGFKDINGFEIVTPVVAVAIALLTLLGLLPRIKEYSN